MLHQAYTGTKFQVPAWTGAVDATAGKVVTYGGALIDAVYSASSGGHTENSEVVWVSAVPYLRGVPDPYDVGGGNPNGALVADLHRCAAGRMVRARHRHLGPGPRPARRVGARRQGHGPPHRHRRHQGRGRHLVPLHGQRQLARISAAVDEVRGRRRLRRRALPTGDVHTAYADGRTIIIGGTANDPDGAPLVRVVSTMGSVTATRETRAVNGSFLVTWSGDPGTRNVCVTVLDTPTAQGVSLGCRDVVVK